VRRAFIAALAFLALGVAAPGAWAQEGGYYSDGAYYVPGASARDPQSSTYWPTNNETAYYYGPYAFAPGYGPYLRVGGDSSWNPNIGTTHNAMPPGDYYTDYGFPYLAVPAAPLPFVLRTYRGLPYGFGPAYIPAYGYPYGPY